MRGSGLRGFECLDCGNGNEKVQGYIDVVNGFVYLGYACYSGRESYTFLDIYM